jgi:hypothetical protein
VIFDNDANSRRKVRFARRLMAQSLPISLSCALQLISVHLLMPIFCVAWIVLYDVSIDRSPTHVQELLTVLIEDNLHAFYRIIRLIAVSLSCSHLNVTWARRVHSAHFYPCLCLSWGIFLTRFLINNSYSFFVSSMHATCIFSLILLGLLVHNFPWKVQIMKFFNIKLSPLFMHFFCPMSIVYVRSCRCLQQLRRGATHINYVH